MVTELFSCNTIRCFASHNPKITKFYLKTKDDRKKNLTNSIIKVIITWGKIARQQHHKMQLVDFGHHFSLTIDDHRSFPARHLIFN